MHSITWQLLFLLALSVSATHITLGVSVTSQPTPGGGGAAPAGASLDFSDANNSMYFPFFFH